MASGIYAITNTLNGTQYIGSSMDIEKRWRDHRRRLQAGIHTSPHLQHAWQKYGADTFTFMVLEYVTDVTNLVAREQHYMDARFATTGDKGYNARLKAHSNVGWRMTAESRAKLAAYRLGRKQRPSTVAKRAASNTGKRRTPEQLERLRAIRRANGNRITATLRNTWLNTVGQEIFSAIRSLPDDIRFENPWQFAGILSLMLPWYSRAALDHQLRRLRRRGILDENGRPRN